MKPLKITVRYLTGRGIAFVRFRNRLNCEFAKEAMLGQTLEHNEILNVKWAYDDPNGLVKEYKKRKAEEIVKKTVLSKLPKIGEKGTILDYEDAYEDAETKSRKVESGQEHYPFYQAATSGESASNGQEMDQEALQKAWAEYYAQGGTPEAAAAYYAQSTTDPALAAQYAQAIPENDDVPPGTKESAKVAQGDNSQYAYDNSAYAYPDATVGNEAYAYPSGQEEQSAETAEVSQSNASETPAGGIALVADYGSDEEDE
jgi:hypothetical protein